MLIIYFTIHAVSPPGSGTLASVRAVPVSSSSGRASRSIVSGFRSTSQYPAVAAIVPLLCRRCSFASRPWRSGFRAASQYPVAVVVPPLCSRCSFASRPWRSGFHAASQYPVVAAVPPLCRDTVSPLGRGALASAQPVSIQLQWSCLHSAADAVSPLGCGTTLTSVRTAVSQYPEAAVVPLAKALWLPCRQSASMCSGRASALPRSLSVTSSKQRKCFEPADPLITVCSPSISALVLGCDAPELLFPLHFDS